ncbi:MAG: DUF979 domain-containing protein [Erysipelotrichaceae bacterium]|nr:DUF979 domain-containing protein [Erysipelotrichaceae bacterium]
MTAAQILGEVFYSIIGLVFILVGVKALKDEGCTKKYTTAAFWFLLAFTFICGPWVPKWLVGAAIIIMAVLTAINGVVQSRNDVPDPKEVRANADKFGYKIFIPAGCIALVAVVGATLGSKVPALSWLTANNAIGLSGLVALCVAIALTGCAPKYAAIDGARLMDNVNTTGILPQLLSALGALFTAAGVGDAISYYVSMVVPDNNILIACFVYCLGMALFTMIMGNGFAAFSVIMVGVGIPFLISKGGDPIIVGALGLTAAYCGTLCTPMAANFNIVPAALLETKSKYSVIKSQIPFAVCMLLIHVVLLYVFAF